MKNFVSFCELGEKNVVNICDGEALGCVCNLELDICSGRVCALYAGRPGEGLFSRGRETRIVWERIECIGEDVILVRLPEHEKEQDVPCEHKDRPRFKLF